MKKIYFHLKFYSCAYIVFMKVTGVRPAADILEIILRTECEGLLG